MITAYLDETEHSTLDASMVLAGFRGNEEQWNRFLPVWKDALGNRKSLHMKNLRWNHRNSAKRIRDLLAKLGPIPYESGLIPVYGAVRVRDYYDLVANEPEFERKLTGYVLCLAEVLALLQETVPAHEKIELVCDMQSEHHLKAEALFRVFQNLAAKGAANPWFQSIKFVRQSTLLEPADYLAFGIGKNFNEPGSKKDLWCRPIHGEQYNLPCRPGAWMPRKIARETVQLIKADVKAGITRPTRSPFLYWKHK